jgi:ESS family glutamate:Na+ symporter
MSSFADLSAWAWLIQFFIIVLALLVANLVRCNVPLFRRSLLPSALLAGLLILCLKPMGFFSAMVDKHSMEIITYHALGLGFVAMALKNKKIESATSTMKVVETGAVTASTYIIQGLVGLLITVPLFLWWNGSEFFYASGLLLPMGYGQGPGQALNFGITFSGWADGQGLVFHGADFGLSIAAIGFIVGSLTGVVYMNVLRRRGKLKIKEKVSERYTLADYETEGEIPHSESIDKLTVQLCLVLLVYALVFALMFAIQQLDLGDFGTKTLKPLVWGFNFLWGTLFGVLVKWIIGRLRRSNLMQREYINNYTLDRIAGTCFDFMIVAGTAAIDFNNLRGLWLPLILVCSIGATVTFFYVLRCCRKLYPGYEYEGFFSMFGMLTGTASNGMILLREIDPRFETPAANNLVLQTIPALAFGFPVLLLMGFAPQSLQNTLITIGIMAVALLLFCLFIFRKRKTKH